MYKKEELIEIVKKCKSKTDILNYYGLKNNGGNYNTLSAYLKKFNIDTTHLDGKKNQLGGFRQKRNLNDILIENSDYMSSNHLKERLYKEGLKQRICELCGQDENWKGKKMSLILDHKNGINDDNRIENLQIVCPNCNSTLLTHCRGIRPKKIIDVKETIEEKVKRIKLNRKVERPPYQQLIFEIQKFGYVGTGRKYNVSDNTIKSWKLFYEKYENKLVP